MDEPDAADATVRSDPAPSGAGSRGWLRGLRPARWREVILFLTLLVAYGYFLQVPAWNEYSRYDLVRSLVDNGTVRIDAYADNTGDKALYAGHYYSDKAPGTALLGVVPYALQVVVYDVAGVGLPPPETSIQLLAFADCAIVTALLAVLLLRFLTPAVGEAWALAASLGFALGTIAFPFATMLFGHAMSSMFLFAAFYQLWRSRTDPRARLPLSAGLLAGCAVITELPVVLGVAVLGVYALWIGRGHAVRFVAGGIPLALVLMAYNWLAFGSPLSIGYQYDTVFGAQNSQGILSVVWPSPATAVDLLVGPRGLLRLSPWLALAPLGLLALRRRDVRPEVVVSIGVCAVFLLYNSGALNPLGGWTPGPRYLLPALPFAAILATLAPARLRPLTLVLIVVSVAMVLLATVTMPNAPEAYADPLLGLWLPRLLAGQFAPTGAWLNWGIDGPAQLAILGLVLAMGAAGLVATFLAVRRARALAGAVAAVLAGLVIAISFPLVPWGSLVARLGSPTAADIAIGATGATFDPADGTRGYSIWADIRNAGVPIGGTKVLFTVHTGPGATWSAWLSGQDWAMGTRRVASVRWDASREAPGEYPYDVRVEDATGATVSERANAGTIRVTR